MMPPECPGDVMDPETGAYERRRRPGDDEYDCARCEEWEG